MAYTLATILSDGQPLPVIEVNEKYYPLREIAPGLLSSKGRMIDLFDDWANADETLDALSTKIADDRTSALPTPAQFDFLTPIADPSKILLAGANYHDHIRGEGGKPNFNKEENVPILFTKDPKVALSGPGAVRYPSQSSKFDWEIEMAAVVSRRLRKCTVEQAESAIAGYSVGIDMAARDWLFSEAHPFKFDLFTGKSFDDSCPVGPRFVPARYIDASALALKLWVNGELMQDGNNRDMIWSPAELLAAASQHVTIFPGDILFTGTPAGVGMGRGRYLSVGDIVEAEISGLGRLEIRIVEDADERPDLQS